MAWDKTKPENDMLLINFPPACRANWDALELLTDPALQITNERTFLLAFFSGPFLFLFLLDLQFILSDNF